MVSVCSGFLSYRYVGKAALSVCDTPGAFHISIVHGSRNVHKPKSGHRKPLLVSSTISYGLVIRSMCQYRAWSMSSCIVVTSTRDLFLSVVGL